jgi:hypothetical protein
LNINNFDSKYIFGRMAAPVPPGAIAAAVSTTSTSIQASATSTAASISILDSQSGSSEGKCELLGGFAIIVQGALGGLALLSLVFKRWRERPQRPLKIWGFDVSKQVVGAILIHMANLLLSMISSGDLQSGPSNADLNPCSFYLLNLAIDVRHLH